jgi:hypothetical protein
LSAGGALPYHPHPVQTDKLSIEGLAAAEALLGPRVLGPAAVGALLESAPEECLTPAERAHISRIPFDHDVLVRAGAAGADLVLRLPRDGQAALTIQRLHDRFPDAFVKKTMTEGVGYLLRAEWAVTTQPFATDAPELGWRLVVSEPVEGTRGVSYDQQDEALAAWARQLGVARARVRRRTAVDAVYDVLLADRARKRRDLQQVWDWTRTGTPDGAFVTIGRPDDDGLQILAYSTAVRFDSLGTCLEVV